MVLAKVDTVFAGRSMKETLKLFQQMTLRLPDHHWNPFHVAALNGWVNTNYHCFGHNELDGQYDMTFDDATNSIRIGFFVVSCRLHVCATATQANALE